MPISEAKARRALRWGDLEWEPLADPRKARGKRHPHAGLLSMVVGAFACGNRTLREAEDFGEDLGARGRRRIGLPREVSDTALYRLLEEQSPEGFAEVMEAQVKAGLRSKAVAHDLFPVGVIAIDGKSSWVGDHEARHAQKCTRDDGSPYWMLFAQRAVMVSSSAMPCVFQQFIPDKTNETACFEACFRHLVERFGKSFEFVTSDAGPCSRHNASVVHGAGKAYLFALKENQPSLVQTARTSLGAKELPGDADRIPELRTVERYRGQTVTRELFRIKAEDAADEVDLAGARQLWRVKQTTRSDDPAKETAVEDRYFVTNRMLNAKRSLKLVRLHWGIENGANWTTDMVLKEDDSCPCTRGNGLAVVSWLRQLAYNLIALWRSHLPDRHGERMSWRRACELLERAYQTGGLGPKEAPATLH